MDSERFYNNSVIELFDDPEELEEVNKLVVWWNRYAFIAFENGSIDAASITVRSSQTRWPSTLFAKTVLWQRLRRSG